MRISTVVCRKTIELENVLEEKGPWDYLVILKAVLVGKWTAVLLAVRSCLEMTGPITGTFIGPEYHVVTFPVKNILFRIDFCLRNRQN